MSFNLLKLSQCRLLAILFSIVICACHIEPEETPDYGLTPVLIDIEAEDFGRLNSTAFDKIPVRAKVTLSGQTYLAEINYAGKSTLDAFKKNYDVRLLETPYKNRYKWRLSSQFADASLIRASIGFQMFEAMGVPSPSVEFVSLAINGKAGGLYQLQELVDEEFFANRDISYSELFKAKFANAGFERSFLTRLSDAYSDQTEDKNWAALTYLWEQVNLPSEDLTGIEKILDVEQYLNYIAVCVSLNHWDGFNNNYYLARFSSDGKFRIYPWDLDRIFEEKPYVPNESIFGSNQLTEKLLANSKWRSFYLKRIDAIINSDAFNAVESEIISQSLTIKQAYINDQFLESRFGFDKSQSDLLSYVQTWKSALIEEFESLALDP